MLSPINPGSLREPWERPTVRVDWLEGSVRPHDLEHGHRADDEWLVGPVRETHAPKGNRAYRPWVRDPTGSLVGFRITPELGDSWDAERCYVVLKGTGLTERRAAGEDDLSVLERFHRWGGDVRRIDLAVDLRHPLVTPRAIRDLFYAEPSRVQTQLGRPRHWGKGVDGETFYLGAGDVLIRVYDKTAEQARKDIHLVDGVTRIEMQLRRKSAKQAADKLRRVGRERWADAFAPLTIGWILDKMRPLDGPRPARNAQRVPTWAPLREALGDVQPVPLGRWERDRDLWERFQAKTIHHVHNRRSARLALEAMGDAGFLQSIRAAKLHDDDEEMLALARETDPAMLRTILADLFDSADLANDETPASEGGLFDEGQ